MRITFLAYVPEDYNPEDAEGAFENCSEYLDDEGLEVYDFYAEEVEDES